MSRLIFRNLPSSLTPDSFKSRLLSPPSLKSASVTDTKLVSNRRFAFVGFKTEDEAQKVKDWFDGSYAFGGGKVQVELVGDEPLKGRSEKKSKKEHKTQKRILADEPEPSNEAGPSKRLQEFMDVMKGNESVLPSNSTVEAVPGEKGWVGEGMKGETTQGRSRKGKEKSVEPTEEEQEDAEDDEDDAAWLRRRQTHHVEDGGDVKGNSTSSANPEEQLILSTSRLFVRNLAFVTTSTDLSNHFSTFGHVEEVHLPNSSSGQPLGTAFVLFRNPEDALSAYKSLDKTTFQGRLLHILPGRAKPGQESRELDAVTGDVLGKVKKGRAEVKHGVEEKRREDSARGVNWATLYMNSDAVAGAVASRMGISKSDLLSGDDSSPAVKLALAETSVIEDTKRYFLEQGLVLDSLSPKAPRSQTIILVKNIPFGTTLPTLKDLFEPHGTIKRILLPPSGTLGVVEYDQPGEASKAFKALSYKRLGNAVLYLEKGPAGMFSSEKNANITSLDADQSRLLSAVESAPAQESDETETSEPASTLFLKNLSFSTSSERLSSLLSSLPGFSFARVQTKPDPKRPGEKLSMGYGFVGFKTRQDADKALRGLQGFEIDGKSLEVKFAQRGQETDSDTKGKGELKGKSKSTKLLVKNLPFEATKKDLRDLFSTYGSLKSLRLPKKATISSSGSHPSRGFAFVEFTTHSEAARVMEALKHTHLLGRHLVLQWIEEGEGVDVGGLRERAGREWRGVQGGAEGGEGKGKRKFDKFATGGGEEDDGLEV